MHKSDSQIIEDAVDIIKANGRCTEFYHKYDENGKVWQSCALGSVALALGNHAEIVIHDEKLGVRYTRIREELGTDVKARNFTCDRPFGNCANEACNNIAHFNDKTSTEEVTDLMMTTAKRLRNEGR